MAADGRFAWAQSDGRPGPRNLITDVAGLSVGQADDPKVRTGVTVILPEGRATCAADVRGGGPGTRETDALNSWNLVHSVDAVVLSGGSVYGLAAADGVAAWLGAHDRGYGMSPAAGVPKSPVIPAAILYDLANRGDKAWGLEPALSRVWVCARSKARARISSWAPRARAMAPKRARSRAAPVRRRYVTRDGITRRRGRCRQLPGFGGRAWGQEFLGRPVRDRKRIRRPGRQRQARDGRGLGPDQSQSRRPRQHHHRLHRHRCRNWTSTR